MTDNRQLVTGNFNERSSMASFNKVVLVGNLTRDPQLRYLP